MFLQPWFKFYMVVGGILDYLLVNWFLLFKVIFVEHTASSCMKILRENTHIYKADLSTKSINILGILGLGSIFWMNLGSLVEYLKLI